MKINQVLALAMGLTFASKASAEIKVLQPWISPSEGKNSSLFMTIINTSNKPDKLVGVETNVSPLVEFHENVKENGKMALEKLNYIGIPRNGRNDLEPGHTHIMLKDINHPLEPGQIVNVRLHFESGNNLELKVPVEKK